jgi:hypothetical protein
MMKKLVIIILLFFAFALTAKAQLYDKSVIVEDFGKFVREVSPTDKISISSYVTKQKILINVNVKQIQKKVPELPKYRYELVLQSNSIYDGNLTKTWIYGAKVFIDGLEVSREQSPDGFTAIINIKPTVIFRYESSMDSINIKITWKSSNYFQGR